MKNSNPLSQLFLFWDFSPKALLFNSILCFFYYLPTYFYIKLSYCYSCHTAVEKLAKLALLRSSAFPSRCTLPPPILSVYLYRSSISYPSLWGHICFRIQNLEVFGKTIQSNTIYYLTPPFRSEATLHNETHYISATKHEYRCQVK